MSDELTQLIDPEPALQAEIVDPPPGERNIAVTDDGYLYDIDTGEVLGLADLPELFEVRDEDSANWVLEKRAAIEAGIVARTALLEAAQRNIQALINAERRKLSYWDFRFSPSLTKWAKTMLTGKSKTLQLAQGKIAFRATKGSSSIINDEAAIAFAQDYLPSAIKRKEWVTVTDALKAIEAAKQATGEDIRPDWIVSTGPSESVTISTGIDMKGSN